MSITNSTTPPKGSCHYITAQVWQKKAAGEIRQVLFMQTVVASSREEAYALATPLDYEELAKQNLVGYEWVMRNIAWIQYRA